eukprot:3635296-Pyramimonas_sp.AAC.1
MQAMGFTQAPPGQAAQAAASAAQAAAAETTRQVEQEAAARAVQQAHEAMYGTATPRPSMASSPLQPP